MFEDSQFGSERHRLERDGFEGFLAVAELRENPTLIPDSSGVYVVSSQTREIPNFLNESPAWRFKGKNPTVSVEVLAARWNESTRTVYIGKAMHLRHRLTQYLRSGSGLRSAHWGGRFIWQLVDSDQLIISWKQLENRVIGVVETSLIRQHFEAFGALPYANLRR